MRLQLLVRLLAVLAWMATLCAPAGGTDVDVDLNAVVRIEGGGGACSGTIVSPDGLIVSAEHCQCGTMTTAVFRDGTSVPIEQVYEPPEKQGRDEAATLRITQPGVWPFIPVGDAAPPAGAATRILGYPGGQWYDSPAKIVAATERLVFLTDINRGGGPGISGGPLLWNGALVGVCSGRGGLDEVEGATVIGGTDSGTGAYQLGACRYVAWAEVKKAVAASVRYRRPAVSPEHYRSRRVIVFSQTNCAPCEVLKRDIAAGHFRQFDVTVYTFDAQSRWNSAEAERAYAAMAQATGHQPQSFPIIWVEGTDQYREGYTVQNRGGLLGFLQGIFEGLIRLVAGEPPHPRAPPVRPEPEVDPVSVPATGPPPAVVPEGYEELVSSLATLKQDLTDLKSGGPIARVQALASLRGDVAAAREAAAAAKDRAKADPLHLLWGLPGLITGLLHRRFAA